MIGDVKMQTIKRRTGRSLTGDRPLFLTLFFQKAQKALVSSLYVIQDWCSVCADDDMMIIQLTLSFMFKSQGKGKSFIYREQSNANRNQSNANRTLIESNRTLIETNRINQEKLWKIRLIQLPFRLI